MVLEITLLIPKIGFLWPQNQIFLNSCSLVIGQKFNTQASSWVFVNYPAVRNFSKNLRKYSEFIFGCQIYVFVITIGAGDGICYEIYGKSSEFLNVKAASKRETDASLVERLCNAIKYWTKTRTFPRNNCSSRKFFPFPATDALIFHVKKLIN